MISKFFFSIKMCWEISPRDNDPVVKMLLVNLFLKRL